MKKRTITIIAVVLAVALALSLLSSGFRDWNVKCWFGHNYADGVCTRCGAEKTDEEITPEPEVSFVSHTMASLYAITIPDEIDAIVENNVIKITALGSKTKSTIVKIYAYADSEASLSGEPLFTSSDKTIYLENLVAQNVLQYNTNYSLYAAALDSKSNVLKSVFQTFVVENKLTELPEPPSKTGYTFTGWYTDSACTNKYTDEYVTGDTTLYAGFRAHTYSIEFNANSGSGNMDNLSMTYDIAKNLTPNAFTKDHYTFIGWATSANGDVAYSNEEEIKNLTTTDGATIELFAQWERSEVKVDFVVEGNTTTTWIAIDTKATLPENPTKEGHNFVGWYFADGTMYETQNLSEDTTLTARFEIIKCTITFMVGNDIYAIYECDWGTSLADALNANNVSNPLLYSVEGEYRRNF